MPRNVTPARNSTRIELPWTTIARIIVTLVAIWLLAQLWTVLLLVIVAALTAAALDPLVRWLQGRGLRRAVAVGVVVVGVLTATGLMLWLLVPPLIDEGRSLAKELPNYVDRGQRILEKNPDLNQRIQSAAQSGSTNPSGIFNSVVQIGSGVVGVIADLAIVLVMAIYILLDGRRIYAWCIHFLPPNQRQKVDRAIPEIVSVVSGYVVGQILTSVLFGVFCFAVLELLSVPQALFLAIIAAFADAIPIAGVIIATVPAALLALTVSIPAAVIVIVTYSIYQQVENHLIVPQVYKNTLRISSFAVLVSVLVGAKLLGIVGVLLALPFAAAFPAIERIWLPELAAEEEALQAESAAGE